MQPNKACGEAAPRMKLKQQYAQWHGRVLDKDGEIIMRITYDPTVDALYIRFQETTVTTKNLADGIAADYDAAGLLAGIEILDAVKRFGDPTILRKITLEEIGLKAA